MGKAYNEIMEKIKVTPEIRRRVLARIEVEGPVPARPKVARSPAWKKYLSAAACLVLVIAGAAALPRLLHWTAPEPPDVQTVPRIEEAKSLTELSELVGFEVRTGFILPFTPEETTYCSYWNEMAQIQYSGQGRIATYRQSAGAEDNSGDHTSYSDVMKITVGTLPVTLKGDRGVYLLAIWADGTFSYSLGLSQGVPEAGWLDILADVL